jgi:hypothetical protein
VLSIVRTIIHPDTTEHTTSPCACNATVGDYHDGDDENRRLNKITKLALSDVGDPAEVKTASYGERAIEKS